MMSLDNVASWSLVSASVALTWNMVFLNSRGSCSQIQSSLGFVHLTVSVSLCEHSAGSLPTGSIWSTKSENCCEAKMEQEKVSAKSCRCWNHFVGSPRTARQKTIETCFGLRVRIKVAFAIPSWGFECVIKSIWSWCLSRQEQIEAFVQETAAVEKYIFGGNTHWNDQRASKFEKYTWEICRRHTFLGGNNHLNDQRATKFKNYTWEIHWIKTFSWGATTIEMIREQANLKMKVRNCSDLWLYFYHQSLYIIYVPFNWHLV